MPLDGLGTLGGLTGRLVTLGLLHAIWIGLATAAVAAFALRVLPGRRRGACYAVLLTLLALTALGPPIATALQRSRVESRSTRAATIVERSIVVLPGRVLPPPADAPANPAPAPPSTTDPPRPRSRIGLLVDRLASLTETLQPVILAAWSLIALPLLCMVAMGLIASVSRRRAAEPAPEPIQHRADHLARRLGLRRGPRVLVHPTLTEPCLCGLARPVVLLPGRWLEGADPPRIDAVLAHELAHHRRLDLPVNLAQRLVESLLFFHPAVLWLSRSLRAQRERCADAMAVALTGDPVALAEALESVARLRLSARRSFPLAEPLGGDDLSLLSRVQELLGMTPPRPPIRRWSLVALPASALVAWLSASIGLAQDPAPPRPEPTATQAAIAPETPTPSSPGTGLPTATAVGGILELGPTEAEPGRTIRFAPKSDEASGPLELSGVIYSGPVDPTPLVSYEVRFLSTEAGPWRDRLKTPLRPLDEPHGDSAWLLKEKDLVDLLAVVQDNLSTNLVQAPKVTTGEGSTANIFDVGKRHYVGDVTPVIGEDSVTFDPIHKSLDEGVSIGIVGTFGEGETTIDLDARYQSIVSFHTFHREFDTPFGKKKALVQVPTTTDQRLDLSATIPDGSTLMVKLGVIEQPAKLPGVTEFAIALFGDVTGTPLKARGTPVESFALITPHRIILREEERLGIPPVKLPASAP
ncbi:M56 family metallopeptidase [Tautonia sp. JC769]|uniref:M56 family metallopeptidase n=2 Tax=Planctomycetia TaxID=203683 RepID=UPI0034574238